MNFIVRAVLNWMLDKHRFRCKSERCRLRFGSDYEFS